MFFYNAVEVYMERSPVAACRRRRATVGCTSHIYIIWGECSQLFDKIRLYPQFTLRPNTLCIPSVAGKPVGGLQKIDGTGFRLKLPDIRFTREITVFSNLEQGQKCFHVVIFKGPGAPDTRFRPF